MQTKSVITQKPGMTVTTDVRAGSPFRRCGNEQIGRLCENEKGDVVGAVYKPRNFAKEEREKMEAMMGPFVEAPSEYPDSAPMDL